MKILHLSAAPEFVRMILLHDLRRLRPEAEHVVIASPGPDLEQVRAEGFAVRELAIERKLAPLSDLASLVRLIGAIRRERPDILHTYTPKAGLLGQIAGWLARVPVRIHSCRGLLYLPGMPAWRRRLFRMTDRITFGLAHRVIFISGADREVAVSGRLCPAGAASFTGSGIDLDLFAPPSDPAQARRERRAAWGVPEGATVVLTVGRFVRDKGYLELAQAARVLLGEHPNLVFVWIAPVLGGEDDTIDESILRQSGLEGRVIRLERQSGMVTAYAAADLLVHPTHREGVPRVLMEAACAGLPIVATDIPGNREVVVDGETALLFPPGDPAGLAAALRRALSDPERTAARAARARARVREVFDQNAVSRRVAAIYREVAPRVPRLEPAPIKDSA
jgi:glycosyltransferase involved in cell wall biosynthesis